MKLISNRPHHQNILCLFMDSFHETGHIFFFYAFYKIYFTKSPSVCHIVYITFACTFFFIHSSSCRNARAKFSVITFCFIFYFIFIGIQVSVNRNKCLCLRLFSLLNYFILSVESIYEFQLNSVLLLYQPNEKIVLFHIRRRHSLNRPKKVIEYERKTKTTRVASLHQYS